NLQDVIFTMDLDLHYTYVSPSVRSMRGYNPSELIGKSLHDVAPPASVKKALEVVAEELKLEESGQADLNRFRTIEIELYCKNGSTIWTEVRFSFIRDEDNRALGFIGINRNITERKRAVSRLKESEEKFRTLAEACPFAIMIYQNDYWVYANSAAETISGFSKEELYRMRFWEIVHPDYRDLVRGRGSRRQAGQKATPVYDFKIIDKAGEERWVSLSGGNLTYEGKTAGLITVIDITERKLAETAVRESEEKYRAILENIEDGYYEVDLAGNFTFFNDFLCRISGQSRDEILGINYREYTDEENAKKLFDTFHTVYETGVPAKAFDLEIQPRADDIRNVEISASLIKNAANEPEGFRGIIRDITERKQAENHKAKLEAQLQQAQKMEAIGTLAGGVAHDFNNILQAINGYTQLLLMRKTPDHPDHKKLTQLRNACERAANLVNQLLTFSRKMEGERRHVSLNYEIQLVEKLLKQTIPKMIERRMDFDDSLWPVYADPVHIEQILLNLGSNAADAMTEGGTLTIETRNIILKQASDELPGAEPGPYVRLKVSDTGCGMDEETVKQIFDPFFTTKEIGKGTGLGLASVYGIVKSHGGYIQCSSRKNQGTSFKIYLPAVSQTKSETKASLKAAKPKGGTETLLLVDDELPIREAASEILEHFGYQVWCAEDAERAIDLYKAHGDSIDMVILDLSMPGIGGNQCLQEILKLDPSAKILISSGYAADGLAKQALASGACGFIGKPYQTTELAEKIRTLLDDKTTSRQSGSQDEGALR
ncbi:MAG: PAS domain S-box protein, partial [Desulfobacterales bacterium]|nr:PAS domain S-box protein [Desulfobacterales bacterium]